MSTEEMKALVSRWANEIWTKADMAAIDELYAPNLTFHYPGVEAKPDLDGFKQTVSAWMTPFSGNQMKVNDVLIAGDKAAVRWIWSGKHTGEYMGIAPTGNNVSLTGISIIHVVGGKIVEEIGEMDNYSFMAQLGAFSS